VTAKLLALPAMRGKVGDWFYYTAIIKFSDLAERTSLAKEIHPAEDLRKLIQREITNRSKGIVEYIENQEQRFFNGIILGIYGGKPRWNPVKLSHSNEEHITDKLSYFEKTFGVITLDGTEEIFPIDGQHRYLGIKSAIKKSKKYNDEEITAIFVAHKNDKNGLIRTRRLFSTLNRYAKPVNEAEIIALDEEDNAAIITRNLINDFKPFAKKILVNKTKSIPKTDKVHFTNIRVLYEFVRILETDYIYKKFGLTGKKGLDHDGFSRKRMLDKDIKEIQKKFEKKIEKIIECNGELKKFFTNGKINREAKSTSLLFRPVGQLIFLSAFKYLKDHRPTKIEDFLNYFDGKSFSLNGKIWSKIVYDSELGRMKPDDSVKTLGLNYLLNKFDSNFKIPVKQKEKLVDLKILK